MEFPGNVRFQLFSNEELIYTSSVFGLEPTGNFAGLLSTETFDAAVILDPFDEFVFIDDLHFGVPAPGTLWLLAFLGLSSASGRRRRFCHQATGHHLMADR